jgi:hypothetical protein
MLHELRAAISVKTFLPFAAEPRGKPGINVAAIARWRLVTSIADDFCNNIGPSRTSKHVG